MRPSGPRVRSSDPRQQRQPVSTSSSSSSARQPPPRAGPPADRDQVFASIFGRPAGGHHTAAVHQTHPSAAPQGYGYNANIPPASGYPQHQNVALNQDPYRQTARQTTSNGGYEAFAPPLPPPPPPNGSVGLNPTGLGGPKERGAGSMMLSGTDYGRGVAPNDAYPGYAYEVRCSKLAGSPKSANWIRYFSKPDYPRVRRTSTTPSVDGSSTYSSRSSLGAYQSGLPSGFTAINPPTLGLPYDSDTAQGIRPRNVSGASTATGYSSADMYNRPQRDSSLPANANLAHNNSITSNRSALNAASGQSYGRYETTPHSSQAPLGDSPGSMYDSIFADVLANSSTTSLPHAQGQQQKPGPQLVPVERNDADSPPPEYSTYAPHDPAPPSTARPYASASMNRRGGPALPEIVRDVKGLRLFDDSADAEGMTRGSRLSNGTDSPGVTHMSPSHSSGHHSYEDELRGKFTLCSHTSTGSRS